MTNDRHLKPRLLYVTTYDPSLMANGGGAWVDQRIVAGLKSRYDVEVFPVCRPGGVPLEIGGSRYKQLATLIRMVVTGEPLQSAKFRYSRAWKRRHRELASELTRVQYVVASQWPGLLMLELSDRTPDVYVAHNTDHILASQGKSGVLRVLRDGKRTLRDETRSLRNIPSVLTLSKTDSSRLSSLGINAVAVTLASDAPVPARSRAITGPLRIGFLGKASWPPNAAALDVLNREVMPRLRREVDVSPRLVIAGRGTEEIDLPDCTSLGAIEDVDEFYDQVDVVVVPRLGTSTGVSVKLLEAVEQGIPAIAPRHLIEDAGVHAGAYAADTPDEIVAILRDFSEQKDVRPSPVGARREDDRQSPSTAIHGVLSD